MKYITMLNNNDEEVLFSFPDEVRHDRMHEVLRHIKTGPDHNWSRGVYVEVVSAGFIRSDGSCHGHSETLNIKSRPKEDTELYRKQLNAYHM